MAIESNNILTWLDELRFSTENYEPFARPLSGGTTELSLLLRQPPLISSTRDSTCDAENMSPYQKLWECTSSDSDKRSGNDADFNGKRDKTDGDTDFNEIKHADVCRVSVVFQNCEEVEDEVEAVRVENIELYLSKDVLEWITDLWYSSEEEDVEEFEEFEKYQQNRIEDRPPPTPKFPVVQEPAVQLRKSNSLKPIRGNSRSNTIHVIQPSSSEQTTEQDIQISAPLKLIWRGGKTETIERGAVVFKNGLLQIQNDTIKSKVEMKMNSTIKNNKICEFSSPEQTLKVSVDREHQITMGSPRQRRKSVEEESPKNFNKQNILMKLLRRRSDKQLLEKKGIFKCEDIFGNKLTVLHETLRSTIPEFVRKAVELIEMEKNIKSEHIYRLSGNMATIQKIRLKIDGKNYKVLEEYKNEIDVLTGCLKLFYRELVEPLIPYRSFDELNKLTMKPPHIERDKAVKNIIKKMETPHKENLLFLIRHLLTVESFKEYNKMNIQSLSIVWGPSMLWYPGAEKCTSYSPYEFSMLVNGILELILTTYQTDPEILHQIQTKNCSTDESNESLDTINEDNIKKSPAVTASTSSKWLFGLRKAESKDKLNVSSWSLTENKKEKPGPDGYFGRSLESLPKPDGSDVPGLIMRMVQNVERYSSLRGLYCKPGSRDPVGKFKKRLQKKSDISKMDPLDMAIALLRFLQELERPLMHKSIYEDFKENFGKSDDKSRMIQVKDGIQYLSKEHQATIEFLVNHILNIFDHQDKDSRENIYNAWLPIFSNSTEINSANSTFMETVLDIYRPKRGLPTSTLPLKTDFDFKFTTRDSTDSIDDEYMTDYDRMGLYLRTSSTVSDSTISFSSFKPRSSFEETKTGQDEPTIKDVDPVESVKLNETLQKKDADTLELANKLKLLMQDAKKDGDTSQKIGDNDNIVDTEKTQIESLQHRLSNLNVDTTKKDDSIKKELETMKKIDVLRKDVDTMKKDVDLTLKFIDTVKRDVDTAKKDVDSEKKDVDTSKKDVDGIKRNVDMKKIIGTIRKDVEKTKNTGDNKFKPLIRTRAQSPSPVRLPAAFMAGKTMQKRPVRNESTNKDVDSSQKIIKTSPVINRHIRTNTSPNLGKKLVTNVDNKDKPPINLREVVLSPVSQRKNYNKVDTGGGDSLKDGDTNKIETKPSLFAKNANASGDNKRIDISKVHFNALNKIIGAQSLESVKARTEMTYKKT